MNRLAKFIVLSFITLISQASNASPPSGKLIGGMSVYKSLTYWCDLEINISDNLASISVTPIDHWCHFLSFNGGPYNITYNGNNIIFHNVDLITYEFGDCYGDLIAEWDGTYLDFVDAVLPAKTGGKDCIIEGYVE